MKRYIAILLCISCVFMFSSCGKEVQHKATIELESNPEVGLIWEPSQSEKLFEIETEYYEEKVDGQTVGKYKFTLTPLDEGMNIVRFKYRHADDAEDAVPVREYDYAFIISKGLLISRVGEEEVHSGPAALIE